MTGWVPTAEVASTSRVSAFGRECGIATIDGLLEWSVREPSEFWDAAIRHLAIPFGQPYTRVLDDSEGVPWARWFPGGHTNAAAMCLDRWMETASERLAVDWHGEAGERITWSRRELHEQVEGLVRLLIARGVARGDRVALFMPMVPEAVAGLIATWRIGAVAVPLFSGFGEEAIRVRLDDGGVCAVLTMDVTLRRGREVALGEIAVRASGNTETVHTVVVAQRHGNGRRIDTSDVVVPWPAPCTEPSSTEMLEASHPLLLAYTSGTTGRPKGAVHVHGGMPVKIAAEGAFQHDLGPGDVLLWFSDMGWIMGPYQVIAALSNGAALCLVEGAPDQPDAGRLWRVVEESNVTVLGMSPTLVRALIPNGVAPVRAADLSSLRVLGSTGEPWDATSWNWYFDVVGAGRCPVINMSGGTEVGGAMLSPHPVQHIPPGSLVGPALGMAVDVFDTDGRPIRGQIGELVCTAPWPGMTQGLYRADDRYVETYWSRWPDVWVQGDLASVEDGIWFLHGRSDDTIMIAGKRLGPIEPESAIAEDPAVKESAAIGGPHPVKGEELVLFVVPSGSDVDGLPDRLVELVQRKLGASFRPAAVYIVDDLPKTRSGKVMRRLVRSVLHGEDPGVPGALDNPEALDEIRNSLGGR